jgi:hypothetical protein
MHIDERMENKNIGLKPYLPQLREEVQSTFWLKPYQSGLFKGLTGQRRRRLSK